jgi:hypothetical protein
MGLFELKSGNFDFAEELIGFNAFLVLFEPPSWTPIAKVHGMMTIFGMIVSFYSSHLSSCCSFLIYAKMQRYVSGSHMAFGFPPQGNPTPTGSSSFPLSDQVDVTAYHSQD